MYPNYTFLIQGKSTTGKRGDVMSDNVNQEILDKLTKVCICKAISKASIKKIIASGADTLEKVQKECGAGSGPCGGKRCTPKIKELLEFQA